MVHVGFMNVPMCPQFTLQASLFTPSCALLLVVSLLNRFATLEWDLWSEVLQQNKANTDVWNFYVCCAEQRLYNGTKLYGIKRALRLPLLHAKLLTFVSEGNGGMEFTEDVQGLARFPAWKAFWSRFPHNTRFCFSLLFDLCLQEMCFYASCWVSFWSQQQQRAEFHLLTQTDRILGQTLTSQTLFSEFLTWDKSARDAQSSAFIRITLSYSHHSWVCVFSFLNMNNSLSWNRKTFRDRHLRGESNI